MASYRRPKGTVVRPIPDWNLQNCGYGGVQNGFAATTNISNGLINTDTQGRSLIVWDLTVTFGKFSAATVPIVNSVTLGLVQIGLPPTPAAAVPADPLSPGGAPPALFGNNFNLATLAATTTSAYVPLSGEGIWRWDNPFPFTVIRPGYTLLLFANVTNTMVGFASFFEVAAFP